MVEYPDRPCPVCKHPMTGRQKSACSGKCRAEASRKQRREALAAALDEAERALRKIRRVVCRNGKTESPGIHRAFEK